MSGTSLDGIDAVLADFSSTHARAIAHISHPLSSALRETLRALNHPAANELHTASLAANELAGHYAASVDALLKQAGISADAVRAIGCHGQTVRHCPEHAYTLQLNNPSLLAELSGIDVVADFRSRDIAAGGQGAPLAPAFHAAVFSDEKIHRVILNLGGIANLSKLAPGAPVIGFDSGPANILLDAWYAQHHAGTFDGGGGVSGAGGASDAGGVFDAGGAWAASGQVLPELLSALLATPYFALPPPKSTGRELFHGAWLAQFLKSTYAPQDVQATLLELTAQSVFQALQTYCAGVKELYLCGGGTQNTALYNRLVYLCEGAGISVASTAALGVPPQQVEGFAFAWLAYRRLKHLSGSLHSVTGARHDCVLGAIYSAA